MTVTNLERSISHIDGPIRPVRLHRLRHRLAKQAVRLRRGPSRNISSALAFKLQGNKILLKRALQAGIQNREAEAARDRLLIESVGYRLLERKRNEKMAANARRRPSVRSTAINHWRRLRDWLRAIENSENAIKIRRDD